MAGLEKLRAALRSCPFFFDSRFHPVQLTAETNMQNGMEQLRRAHFSCAGEGTRRAGRCRVPFLWFVSLGKQRNERKPDLRPFVLSRQLLHALLYLLLPCSRCAATIWQESQIGRVSARRVRIMEDPNQERTKERRLGRPLLPLIYA